jgi:hypothetical protein
VPKRANPPPKIGAEPRYRFILNPYKDARFTRCPDCEALMKVRKTPLLIHIEPKQIRALRKTVKYCPVCDILIVHQDELEQQLAYVFAQHAPELVGNNYFVFGTLDPKDWKAGLTQPAGIRETLDRHHPFKEELEVHTSGGWMPIDAPPPPRERKRKR